MAKTIEQLQQNRACLLHKLFADTEEVPEVLSIVNYAIEPVCLQGLCHSTKRWLYLLQGLLKIFHLHLYKAAQWSQ